MVRLWLVNVLCNLASIIAGDKFAFSYCINKDPDIGPVERYMEVIKYCFDHVEKHKGYEQFKDDIKKLFSKFTEIQQENNNSGKVLA